MTLSTDQPCTVTLYKTFGEDALERRVRSEYREMPGLRLTLEQAMRMWALDRDRCKRVLDALVRAHFLELDRTGRYARAHAGHQRCGRTKGGTSCVDTSC